MEKKIRDTTFFQINALGIYKIFTILGVAFIEEGR